jgi:hypothetical protein
VKTDTHPLEAAALVHAIHFDAFISRYVITKVVVATHTWQSYVSAAAVVRSSPGNVLRHRDAEAVGSSARWAIVVIFEARVLAMLEQEVCFLKLPAAVRVI